MAGVEQIGAASGYYPLEFPPATFQKCLPKIRASHHDAGLEGITLMPKWINKGTDITEAYDKQQGREIVLDEPNRQWKLIVTHRTGVRRTPGHLGQRLTEPGRDY